jgi:drug/metabolite transporter (DMT)-like permease
VTPAITLAVLAAGFLHAVWNALLKSSSGGDATLDTAAIVAGSTICGFAILPFVPLPAPAAWIYIAASSAIHFGYYITLSGAYRTGDLTFAYPLMRGTAPLLVTVLGALLLRELPTPLMTLGIVLVSLGILSIALLPWRAHSKASARWAFANAALIAAYTLVDGTGARSSGNAVSYVCWLIALEGLPYLLWIFVRHRAVATAYVRRGWRNGLIGGACSLAAYGIVLWAMTRAPIAAVAALRETSVLFAAALGSAWLKERFGWPRIAGAISVVAGISAMKLG